MFVKHTLAITIDQDRLHADCIIIYGYVCMTLHTVKTWVLPVLSIRGDL